MKNRLIVIALVLLAASVAAAQSWRAQTSGTDANLRGISAVSPRIAWASGSGGTWLRTIDSGATWKRGVVPGAEALDFRDIEAFDENTAILMSAGPGDKSRIYKTTDGGAHWQMVFQNPDEQGFWDCMAFWDKQHGVMLGDPVNSRFQVFVTDDGADHWSGYSVEALPGEAAFAASGTCIATQGQYKQVEHPGEWTVRATAWFVTGGSASRVFRSTDAGATWKPVALRFFAGSSSSGLFSLAFRDQNSGIAVGGDFQKPQLAEKNIAVTHDSGITWKVVKGPPPHGYRSAVAFVPDRDVVVAVGTSGSDFSTDGGRSWKPIDGRDYNAVSFTRDGAGWAVGPKGAISRWEWRRTTADVPE
jgi:photosystem II stability/assembly factor-like uncharacterized protein